MEVFKFDFKNNLGFDYIS